ncbi:hypothetical protein ACEWY4_005314 [Coilia grayii]|uniref:Doublecortin domain-containing protein n=1 Tax=Coilia grayii TaxID=363190 RepID=A0ABD1KHY8_9TELE
MHSGPSGSSDLNALFKNEPQPEPPSALRPRFPAFVTIAPAKKITFFKSGDTLFGGVRMAIHHRSFKCFDALLDDLSQKVPLPFGVRTITTPRGTHSIKRLEQLEDGGCYLCSDRRYTKPINMELAAKRPAMWYHHSRPHSGRRKPVRPEEAPPEHASSHFLRHPKRVVLVKNTDPSVRRSIILSRRTARSLRVFMEEVSELMQCHIKKLYTIQGRKIDSIQSLVHCPNVLVCVGREPFQPLMVECRKSSEDKLPGMGNRSHSSLCSDGHESKKNVNFGLETKKSIIHPRSDSSNRSTRFSLSSEKSYPNGLCTPGQSGYAANCPHAKETVINDDIEKRVLVNKDGSLSVEMKVRFRLTNDETLQWSTEIKKSPGASNDTLNEKEANPHYLQQGKESSEQSPESSGEVEEVFATKLKQRQIDETHCENCCNHCQDYDIWKNPVHRQRHRKARCVKSSSSSTSSHKVVRKEASVDSIRTISRSSEEYTEHVVEKASCYQQMVEGVDTVVEYCTISRCCSRSEVCSMAAASKSKKAHTERNETEGRMTHSGENRPDTSELKRPHSGTCCVEITKASDTDDRPASETSNSSKVLETLKEDQDDDFDLPPSASRASRFSQSECENEDSGGVKNCCKTPDERLLSPKRRGVSACSVRSLKHNIKNASTTPADQEQNNPMSNERPESTESRSSSKSHSSHCGAVSPQSAASDTPENAEECRPQSSVSKSSKTSKKSHRSNKDRSPSPRSAALNGPSVKDEGEEEKEKEERTLSAMSGVSKGSRGSSACPHCGGCTKDSESASRQSRETPNIIEENEADVATEENASSVMSAGSVKSAASKKVVKSTKSTKCDHHVSSRGATPASDMSGAEANGGGETVPNGRVESALSNHSNASAVSKKSNRSVCSNCRRLSVTDSVVQEQRLESVNNGPVEEERAGSCLSNKSGVSHKSDCSTSNRAKTPRSNHSGSPVPTTGDVEERDGATSAQSNSSRASRMSRNSHKGEVYHAGNQADVALEKQDTEEAPKERSASVLSSSKAPSREYPGIDEVVDDKAMDARAASALSNKTDASVKSHKSNCSASKRAKSPATENPGQSSFTEGEEIEKRPNSALSAKSNVSAASASGRPPSKASDRAATQSSAVSDTCPQETDIPMDERAASVLSNRSNVSPKQSCSDGEPLPQEENMAEATVGGTAEEPEELLEGNRAPSAMSTASVRSRTSHKSACSSASRAKSPRATTTKINELNGKAPEEESKNTCDSEDEAVGGEERAASVMSNKTDASVKSKACQKLVLPALERAKSPRPKSPAQVKQDDKENEAQDRPVSALSVKSDVSRTSRRSKRVASPANPHQNEISCAPEKRPSSAMSKKSIKSSPKTNEITDEEACSKTTVKNEIPEPLANSSPAEKEEENEERAASVMSNKTDASEKSRVSHKSTRGASDKAQTARNKSPAPSYRVKEDEIEKRPLSSLSVRTDVSRLSRKSKAKEGNRSPSPAAKQRGGQELEVASEERPISAMSKKSTKSTKTQCKEENDVQERVPSVMSSKTTASIKSSESQKASPNADTVTAKEAEVRPESLASQTSDRESFKGASERVITQAECTDTPAGQEVNQAAEEITERSNSALSVASQSPKKSNRALSPRPKSSQSKISKPEEELRASSAMSVNSKVSSRSKKCQCNHTPPKTPESPKSRPSETPPENTQADNAEKSSLPDATMGQEEPDGPATVVTLDQEAPPEHNRAESVRSARSSTKTKAGGLKKEKEEDEDASSTSSAVVIRSKSPASTKAKETLNDLRPRSSASMRSEKSTKSHTKAKETLNDLRPRSSASMRSEKSTKSHTKVPVTNGTSNQAAFLNVIVPQIDIDAQSENGSVKSFRSTKKAKSVKFDKDPETETMQPNKNKPPTIRLASSSSDSVLSNALSAADLLRGLNTRPASRNSKRNVAFGQKENDRLEIKSNKSSKYAKKNISCSQKDEQSSSLELVESCLPNASSTDVVNEWLKNIPIDGPVYQMEDEFNDSEEPPRVESLESAEDSIQNYSDLEDEQVSKSEENDAVPCEAKEDVPEEPNETKDDVAAEEDLTDPCGDVTTQAEECISDTIPSKPRPDSPKNVCLPKRAHSSVQVMKALLSPKFDRCNSLPEVSPVYGRKLSRSAEGLLDCLAKLRLIDSDPANTQNAKYTEVMNILQTLWLYKPPEWDPRSQKVKDHPLAEDEANPRSSSGVDVSSGSDESAKSMVNSGAEKVESAPPTVLVEQQPDSKVQEDEALDAKEADIPADKAPEEGTNEEGVSAPGQVEEAENEEVVSDADTPDVAARVQGSPEHSKKSDEVDTKNVPKEAQSAMSPKKTEEAVQSPDTSSGKESRSANEMESDRPECSSSGTPPSVKQAELTRKVSHDPDPTWVLSLLKKIEKQFMTHYANAMAEFKVRWALDDNVMLDTMINELKVEVQKRIQNSIKRELQKIQGRAGKSPKPPTTDLSKESVQTEQRRRRLKVMRNRSLKPSNSNGSDAASGSSFSDQRSDDEYCPCDACMRKKMEAKQVVRAEVMNIAPVRMDFDLRKILQVKKNPPPAPKVEAPPPATQPESLPEVAEQQDGNLDVVEEEPEQEEDAPEETNAQPEEEKPDESGERGDSETGDRAEQEEDGEGEEAEQTNENLNTEEGEGEQTAVGEDAVEETGEDADEGETANVNDDGDDEGEEDADNQDGGDDEDAAKGSVEEDSVKDAAEHQQSKDETEDEAFAENTPMDDTEGDAEINQADSTDAVDEIQEDGVDKDFDKDDCCEDEAEKAGDAEGDTTVQSSIEAEQNEEGQDQEKGEDEAEEETAVEKIKAARGDSWEQFRKRQMTRTSVESQPGSLDSMELQLEAKQIVQSVFSSIQGPKRDWDETDESPKSTLKKRSRSPARANKPRRPKDSDTKVDDLEF